MKTVLSFRCLAPVLACALLLGLATAPAWGATYGELSRFKPSPGLQLNLETDAFGVDPSDSNSVYVGDEPHEEEYRVRKFSAAGTKLGEALIKLPADEFPDGTDGIEGVAIDSANKRFYVLVLAQRKGSENDGGRAAAGSIYAFKTEPNGKKELEPAPGTGAGGLLTDEETLEAQSETHGTSTDPLIEPAGIAVDPNSVTKENELVILAKDDERAGGEKTPVFHLALQHVKPSGALGARYVDPQAMVSDEVANSPAASAGGQVYFQRHEPALGFEAIARIPASSTEAPEAVYQTGSALKEEELVEFDPSEVAPVQGGGLSAISEGEGNGRFYTGAEIIEDEEVDGTIQKGSEYPGILALSYHESGESTSFSEYGWTGGAKSTKGNPCGIGGISNEFLPVAAAGEGKVFVLDMTNAEVIEFGPEGKGCPTASAKLVAEANETPLAEGESVPAGTEVTLSSLVVQGDVLKVEWEFDDGSPTVVQEGKEPHEWEMHPIQEIGVTHKFEGGGPGGLEPTVTERIETDNLATPEIELQRKLILTAQPPKISHNPENKTVKEGEEAQFTASATGEPKPTVQWQVKKPGGEWLNDTADSGTSTDTLTIEHAKVGESGNEYRAVFKSANEEATSKEATLTVIAANAASFTIEKLQKIEGEPSYTNAKLASEVHKTVDYEVIVKNTSAVSVKFGKLTDSNCTAIAPSVEETVAAGHEERYTCHHELTAAGVYSNEASIDGEGAGAKTSNRVEVQVEPDKAEREATKVKEAEEAKKAEEAKRAKEAEEAEEAKKAKEAKEAKEHAGQEVLPQKEASPDATLASASLSVSSSGAVMIEVKCPAGATSCIGTITLKTLTAVSANAHAVEARKAVLTLASGSFDLAGGSAKAITLHLSAKARALLAHSHTLRAKATILARNLAGESHTTTLVVTLRPAAHHGH